MEIKNLALALVTVSAAYGWRRSGFRVPRALPVSPRVAQRLLVVAGYATLVILLSYSGAEIVSGRAEVSLTSPRYASRSTEPERFWAKVLPNIAVALVAGGALVAFGRGRPDA